MDNKEYYIQLINDTQLDSETKYLVTQFFCIGYTEGKAAAFQQAIDLISYPKKESHEHV